MLAATTVEVLARCGFGHARSLNRPTAALAEFVDTLNALAALADTRPGTGCLNATAAKRDIRPASLYLERVTSFLSLAQAMNMASRINEQQHLANRLPGKVQRKQSERNEQQRARDGPDGLGPFERTQDDTSSRSTADTPGKKDRIHVTSEVSL
jgi:hypothetical protein